MKIKDLKAIINDMHHRGIGDDTEVVISTAHGRLLEAYVVSAGTATLDHLQAMKVIGWSDKAKYPAVPMLVLAGDQ